MARAIPFLVQPLQPELIRPFHRPGWVYEEKIDGWRMIAYKRGRDVRLVSRRAVDHTERFADLAQAIAALPGTMLVLDGEVAVFDERLISRFDLLSDPDPGQATTPPVYIAFDVLYARGKDLRTRPLRARREVLERLVADAAPVFAVPRLPADGLEAWAEVERRGLEGYVGKDPESTYVRGGPTRSWLKAKVRRDGRFIVGGAVKRTEGWGLLVGEVEAGALRYRGLVHFGVGGRLTGALTANGLTRARSPFADRVPVRGVIWLEPRLTAQISYAEILPGGCLHAGVFRGFAVGPAATATPDVQEEILT
jgi:bifunctional non-homologous end joining protein LigD